MEQDQNNKIENTTIGQLPLSRGKTYIQRILSVYSDLFKNKYGFYPSLQYGKLSKLIQSMVDNHTELQIASMMIVFFDWAGMNGDDDFTRDKIINAAHSFGWFYSTVNTYEIYLRNVYKLEFDNEDKVREFVAQNLLSIKG